MEDLEKIIKSKDVSLEAKARIIDTLVFLITTYGCESWTVMESGKKKKMFEICC